MAKMTCTAQKIKFFIKEFFLRIFLVTFTEEIVNKTSFFVQRYFAKYGRICPEIT